MASNTGNLTQLFRNWLVLALGILVVSRGGLVDGIYCSNGLTLVAVVVVLSLLNTLLRPVLMVVALPLIVMSFGLFLFPAIWLINATLLYLVGHTFSFDGFRVSSFSAAMWGALWISIISWLLNALIGGAKKSPPTPGASGPAAGKAKANDDDVIDV